MNKYFLPVTEPLVWHNTAAEMKVLIGLLLRFFFWCCHYGMYELIVVYYTFFVFKCIFKSVIRLHLN